MSTDLAPEKSRRDVLLGMLQKEYPNYHPLVSIARIAHDENADLKLQFECHKTVAKYVEPELKSIEVKGGVDHRHRVSVSLFEQPEGAQFSEAIEGESRRLEQSGSRELPGGAVIDDTPEEVDRVVTGAW